MRWRATWTLCSRFFFFEEKKRHRSSEHQRTGNETVVASVVYAQVVFCHAELTARDLLQRRDVDAFGRTCWRDSAVVQAAVAGELVVLDGLERLAQGVLVAALSTVLCDRCAQLPDGSRLVSPAKFQSMPSDVYGMKKARRVHPAFRLLALVTTEGDDDDRDAQCSDKHNAWLQPELHALPVHFHALPPLSRDEQARLSVPPTHGGIRLRIQGAFGVFFESGLVYRLGFGRLSREGCDGACSGEPAFRHFRRVRFENASIVPESAPRNVHRYCVSGVFIGAPGPRRGQRRL